MPQVSIGNLDVELNRKDIKNLHISVLPPDGRVRVSAPLKLSEIAVRAAVVHRLAWIKKKQREFTDQRREPTRQFISGETHYLWGRRYRLEVIERSGKHEIKPRGNKLRMYVQAGCSDETKKDLLNAYYRQEIKAALPELINKWKGAMNTPSVTTLVRKMRTKWGSCNIEARRIIINSDLAKKPPECLDFIVLHEMIHLLERHHTERFKNLMTKFMPSWEDNKILLNTLPVDY